NGVALDMRTAPVAWAVPVALAATLAATLSGCAVGPDFKRPPVPTAADYGSASARSTTVAAPGPAGNAQRLVAGMDIPAQWWTVFQSSKLDDLVAQAIKSNP